MKKRRMVVIKKIFDILGSTIVAFLATLAICFHLSVKWMFKTWNSLTMDELVYHLLSPLDGTNSDIIKNYVDECIAPTVLVLFGIIILYAAIHKRKKYARLLALVIGMSVAILGVSIIEAYKRLDVEGYQKNKSTYSYFIDDNYVEPTEENVIFPKEKRNLIYIFLESMETTYANIENGGAFEKNVIPELTELAQENEDFSGGSKLNGGISLTGSTWTMGAMFAQTTGMPLMLSINGNDMDTQDSFFPRIVALGDILEKEGYEQTLLIGSNAEFGGRKLYFSDHGGYDIIDYEYAVANGMIPKGYNVWWGFEDQKLFAFAKEKILELATQDKPFNTTLLTVDTHFEDGYMCELCENKYDDQYANVMACASRQVEEFVEWAKEQDFYENTTIVIVGDHPTMDSDFCDNLDEEYVHRVYTSYINSAVNADKDVKRKYSTFDMFPTTLASLGVEIDGNRLGLGTNLFSDELTLIEFYGVEAIQNELARQSKLMNELAEIDENKEELMLREGKISDIKIDVGDYQVETGYMPVMVYDIPKELKNIEAVLIAVWTDEQQNDLQWIQMEKREDGNYEINISVPSFNYASGEYQIHAYVEYDTGNRYKVGEAIGIVN